MIANNKIFLKWFIRFGKTKANIFYLLFLIGSATLFWLCYCLLYKIFSDKTFFLVFRDSKIFSLLLLVILVAKPWNFYEDALKKLREYDYNEKRGLTTEDTERIKFVKEWVEHRKVGKLRYCLFNKGIFAGMTIFMPVPLVLIILAGILNPLSEFYISIVLIMVSLIVGYFIGVIIYSIRWQLNEDKFIKLTDPLP